MKSIKILNPSYYTTIQDNGRKKYQNNGIPISGSIDLTSNILCNYLVGNPKNYPVIESSYSGLEIQFNDNILFSITGAETTQYLNNKKIDNYTCHLAKKNDILKISKIINGFRYYIGLSGLIESDVYLSSRSTYEKIQIGGFKGRRLNKNDVLKIDLQKINYSLINNNINPNKIIKNYLTNEVRIIESLEIERFTKESLNNFYNSDFEVTNSSDRMGMRLKGDKIINKDKSDIISSPIYPGIIQIPKNGNPIIMLNDCQTTGGYARLGCVIRCDMHILAQKKPGDYLRFKKINLIDAKKEYLRQIKIINNLFKKNDRYNIKINDKIYYVEVEEIENGKNR